MKYKVGDRVLIRPDLKEGERYYMEGYNAPSDMVVPSMADCAGKVIEIEGVYSKYSSGKWSWTDGMIAGLAEDFDANTQTNDEIQAGDFVIGTAKATDYYLITEEGWIGEVESVYGAGKMRVCGLEPLSEFSVDCAHFRKITAEDLDPKRLARLCEYLKK